VIIGLVGALINVSPAQSPPVGCYFFLIKSNQKSSDKKSFRAPCRFYFSPQLKVKTSIPASVGPLFITAPRSFVLSPLLRGELRRLFPRQRTASG
jgi:hypothetical protein